MEAGKMQFKSEAQELMPCNFQSKSECKAGEDQGPSQLRDWQREWILPQPAFLFCSGLNRIG